MALCSHSLRDEPAMQCGQHINRACLHPDKPSFAKTQATGSICPRSCSCLIFGQHEWDRHYADKCSIDHIFPAFHSPVFLPGNSSVILRSQFECHLLQEASQLDQTTAGVLLTCLQNSKEVPLPLSRESTLLSKYIFVFPSKWCSFIISLFLLACFPHSLLLLSSHISQKSFPITPTLSRPLPFMLYTSSHL